MKNNKTTKKMMVIQKASRRLHVVLKYGKKKKTRGFVRQIQGKLVKNGSKPTNLKWPRNDAFRWENKPPGGVFLVSNRKFNRKLRKKQWRTRLMSK